MFMTVGFVLAERVLYLPSIGVCLFVGVCAVHAYSTTADDQHARIRAYIPLLVFTLVAMFTAKSIHVRACVSDQIPNLTCSAQSNGDLN
jgi:hypothetical protein